VSQSWFQGLLVLMKSTYSATNGAASAAAFTPKLQLAIKATFKATLKSALFATLAIPAVAQAQAPSAPAATGELPLFAVEITVGPAWDTRQQPQDQAHFREHSSSLKRLHDAGVFLIGGRYADKGLIILAAKDEASARALMEEDPSIRAEVFKYQLHAFNVFYGGTVNAKARRAAP
jgi:uncharacterized protein YciI